MTHRADQLLAPPFHLRFIGVGNSHATELGSSSAVVERGGGPLLLIDCGPDVLPRYLAEYGGQLPGAIFVTHAHLDHIGGLENLFYRVFKQDSSVKTRLFVPIRLVEILQRRLADFPNILAEGGKNFWDEFQLIPVSERFWLENLQFEVFPVRHHSFHTAFGICLPGHFLFTGDTRPIPEVLNRYATRGELVFHDCDVTANPSHTGIDEIPRCYREEQWRRMVLYHYGSWDNGTRMEGQGYRVARPGQSFELSTPVVPRETDVRGERLLSVIDAAERPDTAVRAGAGRDRTGTD
jgi:ribonuclease BN (tRNA processing enzyme)